MLLFYAPNSCSLASHLALEHAGADYQLRRVDFGQSEQRSPEFLRVNPKARVPALVTSRGTLTETPAILAFVAQSYPASQLAPLDDPFAFAEVQSFNSYLCATVHVAHAHRMRGARWADDAAAIEAMKKKVPQSVGDCFEPFYARTKPHIDAALAGEEREFEREMPDPRGGPTRYAQMQYIPHVVDGTVQGVCVLGVDISRRKRAEDALHELERQLRATERLAAMATLAAGIGHEINNPLASVLANIELALEGLQGRSDAVPGVEEELLEARSGVQLIGSIVQNMRLLARGDLEKWELVDVNTVVEQSVAVAAHALRYRAHLVRDLGEVGQIEGNASQLAQVCVNLLLNAAQALPEETSERNEIRLTTRRENGSILIEVADNGCGIPEHVLARIFDPFFTTKDVAGGMGLGLSISYRTVTALGGKLSVTSQVGAGSSFRVVLPAAKGSLVQERAEPEPEPPGTVHAVSPAARGSESLRILIIDDQASLAQALRRMLVREHEVEVVNEPREAVALLTGGMLTGGMPSAGQPDFDIIICDLMMPGLSGDELYTEVIAQRPELAERFIFMTGGAFTARGSRFLDKIAAPVLHKPFDAACVRTLVREHGAGLRKANR